MTALQGPIRVGFVGANHAGRVLIPAFRRTGLCVAAGIAARRPESAAGTAAEAGIARAFADWRELAASPEIDAVVVATPPTIQPEIALAAIAAGKPVFCEKPLAIGRAEAEALTAAAVAAGLANAVDFIFPEIDAWRRARDWLRRAAPGPVRHVAVDWRVETYTSRHRVDCWKTRAEDGGGVLYNFGCHVLHYLEWLFGPVATIAMTGARPAADDWPARVRTDFALGFAAAGAPPFGAKIFIDTAHAGTPHHRVEVGFEAGRMVLENIGADYAKGFSLRFEPNGAAPQVIAAAEPGEDGDGRIAPSAAIAGRFLAAVQGGGALSPGFADGLRVNILLDYALKSYDHEGGVAVPAPSA
jgi:predicted dehydrogenase